MCFVAVIYRGVDSTSTNLKGTYKYPDVGDAGIVDFINSLESREKDDRGDPEIAAWR